MPLARLPEPFDHPDWLFELKFDGFRALAYIEDGCTRLVSRKGNVYKSFNTLCAQITAALHVKSAVLDGEIVYLDGEGRPQFYSLLRRRNPQRFVAFDLLWLNGRDLTRMPLLDRKAMLRSVVPAGLASMLYVDYFEGNGTALFRAVCENDLEGIVAKHKNGLYTPEEPSWIKIKNRRYTQMEGRRELFVRRRGVGA